MASSGGKEKDRIRQGEKMLMRRQPSSTRHGVQHME